MVIPEPRWFVFEFFAAQGESEEDAQGSSQVAEEEMIELRDHGSDVHDWNDYELFYERLQLFGIARTPSRSGVSLLWLKW